MTCSISIEWWSKWNILSQTDSQRGPFCLNWWTIKEACSVLIDWRLTDEPALSVSTANGGRQKNLLGLNWMALHRRTYSVPADWHSIINSGNYSVSTEWLSIIDRGTCSVSTKWRLKGPIWPLRKIVRHFFPRKLYPMLQLFFFIVVKIDVEFWYLVYDWNVCTGWLLLIFNP